MDEKKKDYSLVIESVRNGFLVTPNGVCRADYPLRQEQVVFNSAHELSGFVQGWAQQFDLEGKLVDSKEFRCSNCGRKSYAARLDGEPCGMTQPNGSRCGGHFYRWTST